MCQVSRVIFILTFCWAFSANLEAQQAAESRQSAAATPIPILQVASQADATLEQLREIEASLAADRTVGSVRDGLSHFTSEIEARIADDVGALKSNPSLLTLHQFKITWESFGGELSAWGGGPDPGWRNFRRGGGSSRRIIETLAVYPSLSGARQRAQRSFTAGPTSPRHHFAGATGGRCPSIRGFDPSESFIRREK